MQKQVDYTEAIKTKYPEQIVFAIAKDKNGKANPMTIGWSMTTSGSPSMIAVAISPKRYTAQCIAHSKCFTIVFPAEEQSDIALFFGTKSGRDTDKLRVSSTPGKPAAKIDSVLLSEAVANFECELEQEITTGDHIIFVGRIVAAHINTEQKKRLYTVETGGKMAGVTVEDS